jgi:hypothetical protein
MKAITKAVIYNLKDSSLKGLVFLKDGDLFLETPSNKIFKVAAVNSTERVDYTLQASIELIKEDGSRAKMVVGGEVDIARSLYNCKQKQGRKLIEIESDNELYGKDIGAPFDVIRTLTKDEDVRITCAYIYE